MSEITKASLESHLADYAKQREELIARLNALAGAESAIRAVLADVDAPDAKPDPVDTEA